MNRRKISAELLLSVVAVFSLTACSQDFSIKTKKGPEIEKSSPQNPVEPPVTLVKENASTPSEAFSSSSSSVLESSSSSDVSSFSASSESTSVSVVIFSSSSSLSSLSSSSSSELPYVFVSSSSSALSSEASSESSSSVSSVTITESSSSKTPLNEPVLVSNEEMFPLAKGEVKKIDFLFVVDNSWSMKDNQAKLAEGFQKFAKTFYERTDLDICTRIITSDRYKGLNAPNYHKAQKVSGTHPTEFKLPCTGEATPDELRAQIGAIISKIGENGRHYELLGKSVVSFLYQQDSRVERESYTAIVDGKKVKKYRNVTLDAFDAQVDPRNASHFFRKDAVANISFLTDENNWFYFSDLEGDEYNDLPAVKNAIVPMTNISAKEERGNEYTDAKVKKFTNFVGMTDNHTGIKEYLDGYFSALNPGAALTYSVTPILNFSIPTETRKSGAKFTEPNNLARNLVQLAELVGRDSQVGDIDKDAQIYADLYRKVGEKIVMRTQAIQLQQLPKNLSVKLIRGDETQTLEVGKDFTIIDQSGIVLTPSIVEALSPGDYLKVNYEYLPLSQ